VKVKMNEPSEDFIRQIHDSPLRMGLAIAGGGTRAIGQMLEVAGASRSVLEVSIPYCEQAMIEWLGGRPDQHCSPETARSMAMVAFLRARRFHQAWRHLAGVGSTASLATDRPKRGPHRVHLAVQTATYTLLQSLQLEKGRRTRKQEEGLVARLLLNLVAETCGVDDRLEVPLVEDEKVETASKQAPEPWQELLLGRTEAIRHTGPAGRPAAARLIFPGAFNPMHVGHRQMAEIAGEMLAAEVQFEISILNVDKPPLDFLEIDRRVRQFPPEQTVWLTRAATFEQKSRCFPGATFILGVDTLRRVANPRYYGGSEDACASGLRRIVERGCRFLVFGRATSGSFIRLSDLDLPKTLAAICREVPASCFRQDISSTRIRQRDRVGPGPGV